MNVSTTTEENSADSTKKRVKFSSKSFDKKAVYIGAKALQVTKFLNEKEIEVLNNSELTWGLEYLLTGNLMRFRKNFKKLIFELTILKPDFVVVDIPRDKFLKLIKTYTNYEFNLNTTYIGDFENSDEFVCKFYNPDYANKVLSDINTSGCQ